MTAAPALAPGKSSISQAHDTRRQIRTHLDRIARLLPPEYRLTLVARHCNSTTAPPAILTTDASLPAVIEALQRHPAAYLGNANG